MHTYSDIKNDLRNIAESVNIKGTSVDLLIELLSKAIYDNQLCTLNLSLESSLSRSTELNSRITLASDLGYSVFRGRNQRVKFYNLKYVTESNTHVDKYDYLMQYGGYNLYYADSYDLIYDKTTRVTRNEDINKYNIDCIVGSGVSSSSKVITEDNKLIVYFPLSDISDDIQVFINGNLVKHQEGLFYSENNSDARVCVLTMSDYGVFIVNRNYNNELAFLPGDIVSIRYITYLPENIDLSDLKTVAGFNYGNLISYTTESYLSRCDNLDEIYNSALLYHRNGYNIKSDYDLSNIIKMKFSDKINGVNIEKDYSKVRYGSLIVPAINKITNKFNVTIVDNIVSINNSDTGDSIDLNPITGYYTLVSGLESLDINQLNIVFETSTNVFVASLEETSTGYKFSLSESGITLEGIIEVVESDDGENRYICIMLSKNSVLAKGDIILTYLNPNNEYIVKFRKNLLTDTDINVLKCYDYSASNLYNYKLIDITENNETKKALVLKSGSGVYTPDSYGPSGRAGYINIEGKTYYYQYLTSNILRLSYNGQVVCESYGISGQLVFGDPILWKFINTRNKDLITRYYNYPCYGDNDNKNIVIFKRSTEDKLILFELESIDTDYEDLTYEILDNLSSETSSEIHKYDYKLGNLLNVNAFYTLKPNADDITDSEKLAVKYELLSTYFMRNVYFMLSKADEVRDEDDKPIPYKLYITICHDLSTSQFSIENSLLNILNSYKTKIGEKFNLYKLIGEIQSIPGVSYIEFNAPIYDEGYISTSEDPWMKSTVSLTKNQFMTFDTENVNYFTLGNK